jgi:phosphoribosylformylglycinamidine synthase
MDFKAAGNAVYLVGETKDELGGSHLHAVAGVTGGIPPMPDTQRAPRIFKALHAAISAGLVRSCHDCSEGGVAVALAEMAFAGEIGADITKLPGDGLTDHAKLFSESLTRFVVEVPPEKVADFEAKFAGLPLTKIGATVAEPRLRIAGNNGEWLLWAKLSELKEAWQKPLRW